MKKMFFLLAVLIVTISSANAQSKDSAAVADQVAKLNAGILKEDTAALKLLTEKSLSFGHSSGRIESQQVFVSNVSQGAIHFKTLDITDQTITVSGENAIVRNSLHGDITNNGAPGEINLKVLMVWHKDKKGTWRLLARQGFKTT
ncbi:MAG: nuclear transport factor 2 family protein [Flavitalea sp.]